MLTKRWLIGVFLISLVAFLIVSLPAALLLGESRTVSATGQSFTLHRVSGTVWNGQAAWRWQELTGTISWRGDWQEFSPGVSVDIRGAVTLAGWVGGFTDVLMLRGADFSLAGALLTQLQPNLDLDGAISGQSISLTFRDKLITDASGRLVYTGGEARWGEQSPVQVPELKGEIEQKDEGPVIVIVDEQDTTLVRASLADNMGALTVYRAWAAALGLSQGGDGDDIVFETSLPLWQK